MTRPNVGVTRSRGLGKTRSLTQSRATSDRLIPRGAAAVRWSEGLASREICKAFNFLAMLFDEPLI